MTAPAAVSLTAKGGAMRARIVVLASLLAVVAVPAAGAQPRGPIVQESRHFVTVTNILRAQQDVAKTAIANLR
jgi:hypothetical protein